MHFWHLYTNYVFSISIISDLCNSFNNTQMEKKMYWWHRCEWICTDNTDGNQNIMMIQMEIKTYWWQRKKSIRTDDGITADRGRDILGAAGPCQGGDIDGWRPPPLPLLYNEAGVFIRDVSLSGFLYLFGFCQCLGLPPSMVGTLQRPKELTMSSKTNT